MAVYKTPGVYVEEISTLPASVAPVATAIPAFIGYTEKAEKNGRSLTNDPTRITSLMEYEKLFGKPQTEKSITVEINDQGIKVNPPGSAKYVPNYIMHYQLQLYYANGGGPCYIVSVGPYAENGTVRFNDFKTGLDAVALEDEPTLIIFTDSKGLLVDEFYNLYIDALAQCSKLQDRFVIADLYNDEGDGNDTADTIMRNKLASGYLNYGASYYPRLLSSLPYYYRTDEVKIIQGERNVSQRSYHTDDIDENGIEVTYRGSESNPTVKIIPIADTAGPDNINFTIEDSDDDGILNALTIHLPDGDGDNEKAGATPTQVRNAWDAWKKNNDPGTFEVNRSGNHSVRVMPFKDPANAVSISSSDDEITLEDLEFIDNANFNAARAAIAKFTVTLPPSAAISGIYARTDRDRGVWIAPANTTMAKVIAPTVKITHDMQENLNVDPTSGKSINAIRNFAGKGTLVWGSRTLAGNDNEWRYVPTRRLFIMVEESIKKATYWAVFEPNDANTWVKIKAQIENFLNGLWRDGALAGASPGDAFFVNVGLGVTMDPQDILEGRMNIEIGMAAVRPAEFIILKFSHKLQES